MYFNWCCLLNIFDFFVSYNIGGYFFGFSWCVYMICFGNDVVMLFVILIFFCFGSISKYGDERNRVS